MKLLSLMAVGILLLSGTSALAQKRAKQGAKPGKVHARPWQIAPELPRALKQALGAVGKIRYSGTRLIQGKNGVNRQRHTELVITDGSRSRIEFPNDSPLRGQVIVETATERRHFLPQRNQLQILPPRREEAFGRIAQMAKRKFVFNEFPGGTVAGLSTELVTIADRQGNVLQKLWIEPKTGMILKRELLDRSGTLVASFEFTQANLHPIVHPTDFVLQPKGVDVITPDVVLNRLMRRQGFKNVRLPSGGPYRLEGARVQKMAEQQVLVQQYTGNGHRISLYQLKTAVDSNRLRELERPDLQIYSWQANGSSYVLVGDLTDAELRDLGRRLGG